MQIIFAFSILHFLGKGEITLCQSVKGCVHCLGAGDDHNIVTRTEAVLIQPVDLPDPPPGAVTDMGLAQFLADSNTHPVAFGTVLPGIEHQQTIRRTLGVIQPLKNVIQFQRTRKSHK